MRGDRFFQRCLAQDQGASPEQRRLWRRGIYDQIRGVMRQQGILTIERMCRLAGVSRAGYYRHWLEAAPDEAGMALRDAVQRAAIGHRHYGYRRVAVLVQRLGY